MYTRFFVADGNFKADHVRNPRAADDVWLSEGGGMMAKRESYRRFLKEVQNRPTVSGVCEIHLENALSAAAAAACGTESC